MNLQDLKDQISEESKRNPGVSPSKNTPLQLIRGAPNSVSDSKGKRPAN